MRTCIICRKMKEDREFNIEHIIPSYLGGGLTIKNVCTDCNGKLGSEVDCSLKNFLPFEHVRFLCGITEDHPLEGKAKLQDGRSCIVKYDVNNNNIAITSNEVVIQEIKGNNTITASGIGNVSLINKAINKKIKRMGCEPIGEESIYSYNITPTIKVSCSIDYLKIYMLAIKISYEFLSLYRSGYYNNCGISAKMRILLNNYISKKNFGFKNIERARIRGDISISTEGIMHNNNIYNRLNIPTINCISCIILEIQDGLQIMTNIYGLLHSLVSKIKHIPTNMDNIIKSLVYWKNIETGETFNGNHHEWLAQY